MKKYVFAALALALAVPAFAGTDTVVEKIVARVNSQIITQSELERSKQDLINELRQAGPDGERQLPAREKDILRDLIDQQLLISKGQELGINADTELVKRLDEIRKQMNLTSMEDLEKEASKQGVSYEDFKQNLKNNIITQKVISQEVGSKIQVTPEEERKYYEEHKAEAEMPEQVRLSEILISTQKTLSQDTEKKSDPIPMSPTEVEQARAKADAAMAELKKGAKFEDVAKKYSEGSTAAQGGDLGFFKRGALAKQLEEKTFALKPGDTTEVTQTKQGFVILKVTAHDAGGLLEMKKVEPQIQEAIYMEKLQPALRTYLTKLREEAYIDIEPGFVDTGASPNQTKPVITTAQAEPEKAKAKKKKKLLIF